MSTDLSAVLPGLLRKVDCRRRSGRHHLGMMAGFIPEKVREAYGLPETVEPVAAIAMGYAGDPKALPENLRAKELQPGKRKAIRDFVFSGAWGRQAEWVEE